jgi:hypothetical protein
MRLDFKDKNNPKDTTSQQRIPEFVDKISEKFYTNGILTHSVNSVFNAIILVNFNGVNKYCVTEERHVSDVTDVS